MRIRWWIILLCLAPIMIVTAQVVEQCATLVQTALESTQIACDNLEIGSACYGHDTINTTSYPDVANFQFQSIGDIESIENIALLESGGSDISGEEWGIARLDIEAISAETSDTVPVTLLAYGDVEISNSFEPDTLFGTVNAPLNVNVRDRPSTSGFVMGGIAANTLVGIIGRNSDGSWLRIRSDEFEGWLSQDFVELDSNISREEIISGLRDATSGGNSYAPMQAFIMQSGNDSPSCEDVPENGLIIQTHTRGNNASLLVNGVLVTFDSTIHLQTRLVDGTMSLVITTLDGDTEILSQYLMQSAQSGQSIFVELDDTHRAIATPSEPVALNPASVDALPTGLLPRNVCVPVPYQAPANVSRSLEMNLTGVNLDELEPLGTPNPELLGNMGWVRLPYNVSNGTGSVDIEAAYARYQPLLEGYTQNGYKTILVLTHQTYGEGREEFLPWTEMSDEQWRHLSDELADMACQIAKQYADQGIATVYQIWNEQDAPVTARASIGLSAENYAYMVTQVAQAIRAADPDALIISGGYSGGPGLGAHHARQTVRLLPSSALLDGIALHPYGRGVDFNSPYRIFGHIDVSIQAYSAVLPGRPIWITEWGVLDRPLDSSEDIAEYALSMLNYMDRWYSDRVASMVWYAWIDGMDNGYGLLDSEENPKAVLYEAFTSFIAERVEDNTLSSD